MHWVNKSTQIRNTDIKNKITARMGYNSCGKWTIPLVLFPCCVHVYIPVCHIVSSKMLFQLAPFQRGVGVWSGEGGGEGGSSAVGEWEDIWFWLFQTVRNGNRILPRMRQGDVFCKADIGGLSRSHYMTTTGDFMTLQIMCNSFNHVTWKTQILYGPMLKCICMSLSRCVNR